MLIGRTARPAARGRGGARGAGGAADASGPAGRPHRALPRRHPAAVEAAGPAERDLRAVRRGPPVVRAGARRGGRPRCSTGWSAARLGAPPARRARWSADGRGVPDRAGGVGRRRHGRRRPARRPDRVRSRRMSTSVLAVGAGASSGWSAGVLARDWWLTRQVQRREAAMLAEFPVVADLLALSVVAGRGAGRCAASGLPADRRGAGPRPGLGAGPRARRARR